MTVEREHPSAPRLNRSLVRKRSVVIEGHKTCVSMEDAFWSALKHIAATKNVTLVDLVTPIKRERKNANLSSAIRLFVLEHYRRAAERKRKG